LTIFVVFSIVTSTFTENREKFLGFGEMAAGTGLLVGPILGGWIYSEFNYFWCYIVLASLVGSDMIFTWFFMPNSVNNNDEGGEDENCEHEHKKDDLVSGAQSEEEKVKYSWMIINRRGLFALSSCGILMVFENFKSAFLSVYLEHKGIDKSYHGWIIAISPFFYIFSGNFIGYVIDKAPRRIFMFFAFILVSFALFMMGPS
jgi:MFS family permease